MPPVDESVNGSSQQDRSDPPDGVHPLDFSNWVCFSPMAGIQLQADPGKRTCLDIGARPAVYFRLRCTAGDRSPVCSRGDIHRLNRELSTLPNNDLSVFPAVEHRLRGAFLKVLDRERKKRNPPLNPWAHLH